MSDHVTEWLNAYLDGELRANHLLRVEAHLAECEACRAELDGLKKVSNLLHEVSAPEFISSERLAAQVSLRLPHSKQAVFRKKAFEIGWWMIPVGLLVAWGLISLSFFINDLLSIANRFGLMTSVSDWWIFHILGAANWSATLARFGVLSGNILDFAVSAETFTRTSLLEIGLQISIALLYLSWIAIGWVRRWRYQHQHHGQLIEG